MIGTHFSVDPDYQELTIALNQGSLAIAVSVAVFVIGGTFLLAASTVVPSQERIALGTPSGLATPEQSNITVAATQITANDWRK